MAKAKAKVSEAATAAAAQVEHDGVVEALTVALELSGERAERLACLSDPPIELPTMEALAEPARPTVGRILHYHTHVKTYPAIVVGTAAASADPFLDLVVFGSPFGSFASRLRVRPGGPGENNTWSWPPMPAPLPEIADAEDQAEGEGEAIEE